jgi:hypothetical protein
MIVTLGQSLEGLREGSAELLQNFVTRGRGEFPSLPQVTEYQVLAALTWWTERLNHLLSVATDPANYADHSGAYSPQRQFETLLSLEQSGRRIQGILVNQRDCDAQRVLAFSALDTLEGLGCVGFDAACRVSYAEKVLGGLEERLPVDVGAVLLPLAERAVAALRECQDSFFLNVHEEENDTRVFRANGVEGNMTTEDATASYLRILRNANHGFGGKANAKHRRNEVLLMSHTGKIPDDLAALPYLFWLSMLESPEKLQNSIATRSLRS